MNLHVISGGIILRLEETPLALDRAGIFPSFSADASLWPSLEAASVPSREVEPVILKLDRLVDEREVTSWKLFDSISARLPLRGQIRTPTPSPLSTFHYESNQRYPKMMDGSILLSWDPERRAIQGFSPNLKGFMQVCHIG